MCCGWLKQQFDGKTESGPERVEFGGRSGMESDGETEPDGVTEPDGETEIDRETKPDRKNEPGGRP